MRQKNQPLSPRRAFFLLAAFVLLCLLLTLFSFQYYHRLQLTIKEESGDYLQEISSQIAANAGKTIEDSFALLGTIATVLKNSEQHSFRQFEAVVRDQQQHWQFERILLVDRAGNAYDRHGRKELLESDRYLREAIVSRRRSMSSSQLMDGKDCIVFALPLDGLVIEGVEISALVATYDLADFDRILSISSFHGEGYGHIIRRDGTVVIRSSSPAAPETGYNILASIADAPFSGSVGAETVLSDIALGKGGQAELTLADVPLCMVYTPLQTQEWCLLTFVPVAVATEKSQLFLSSTLLIGVLVALAFTLLLAILLDSSRRHKRSLEQLAFVDPVTGNGTIQRFYAQAGALLADSAAARYALVYTNINKFKVLNEQLGRPACDVILKTTAESIAQDLGSEECMGRIFADNFCILLRYETEAILARRLSAWTENYNRSLQESGNSLLPLTIEIGIYVVEDPSLPIQDMMDRAKLALRESARELDPQLHYRIYDERVRRRLLREKQLEDRMASALENHEFQVYLQPKYAARSERIGGAEALARWQSPTEGMIYPDEFIPLFEKNGFIIRLDLWVFEQVCITLRTWLDCGRSPVCISVNCSRVHLKTPGFLEHYRALAAHYRIPPELLEIELTETVVFEDVTHLTQIIEEIHALGFRCSMDDFGSGYSSLNLIQDIPVDVLKLDKVFFRRSSSPARAESVVASILTMAHALSMETVAEGVEERHQVELLRRLGCDYIQGYYFAKPLPIPAFEALAFGPSLLPQTIAGKPVL